MYIFYSAYSGAWVYSDFSYDKTEPLTTADTAVTFDYHGFKVQQKITVTAKKPSKLSVITAPDKTCLLYTSFFAVFSAGVFRAVVFGVCNSEVDGYNKGKKGRNDQELSLIHI